MPSPGTPGHTYVRYSRTESRSQNTPCMFSAHKDNRNTIQVYLVTAMTHVIVLEAGQSSQGALKPITPVQLITNIAIYFQKRYIVILSFDMSLSSCLYIPPLLGDRKIKSNIKNSPPPPPPNKQCATVRGLLSVNVLLAMLITVTVFSSHWTTFFML